jgi:hypothetical protein
MRQLPPQHQVQPLLQQQAPQQSSSTFASARTPITTLFVASLGMNTTEAEIREIFHLLPGFRRMRVSRPKPGGPPVAFVDFVDVQSSTAAMNALQGTQLQGCDRGGLRIEYSKSPMGAPTAREAHASAQEYVQPQAQPTAAYQPVQVQSYGYAPAPYTQQPQQQQHSQHSAQPSNAYLQTPSQQQQQQANAYVQPSNSVSSPYTTQQSSFASQPAYAQPQSTYPPASTYQTQQYVSPQYDQSAYGY